MTVRYFCIVQKQKGVADAMIKALLDPGDWPHISSASDSIVWLSQDRLGDVLMDLDHF
jgi:hypothetical protein